MQTSIPMSDIVLLLETQLHFFHVSDVGSVRDDCFPVAMEKMEVLVGGNRHRKYYTKDGHPYFNPFHTVQWFQFLYLLSREAYLIGSTDLADRIYCLNKMMSGADLFYEVEMPTVWSCDHPVGAVIGRAKIGEGFRFMQGCVVGNNKGVYPIIRPDVTMYARSMVLGNSVIPRGCKVAAGQIVIDGKWGTYVDHRHG